MKSGAMVLVLRAFIVTGRARDGTVGSGRLRDDYYSGVAERRELVQQSSPPTPDVRNSP